MERDKGLPPQARKEKVLVGSETFESYRYIANQLTEEGLGPYLIMEDPESAETDAEKKPIFVVSPAARSDAFWETVSELANGLKGVAKEKIAEVRERIVLGKIQRIRAETAEYSHNPYASGRC